MKGNISNIIEGEFKNERNNVKSIPISISLKNSNSDSVFKMNTKLSIIVTT